MRIYVDPISGHCDKVVWLVDHLQLEVDRVTLSVLAGDTRTTAFLALNPKGRAPVLVLDDGQVLSESNAILEYLAAGSPLVPTDRFERSQMLSWMFWEQATFAPTIAQRRFHRTLQQQPDEEIDPKLLAIGRRALALVEGALKGRRVLVGESLTLADVTLLAYSRLAGEGGFDLEPYPSVRAWMARVAGELKVCV